MSSKICVLDYDDTIFCSSWLVSMKKLFGNDMSSLRPSFSKLETAICKLLDTIQTFGYRTYIVTNSEAGWVELSAGEYIPSILDKLMEVNAPIISARSQYEQVHGYSSGNALVSYWKKEAITNLLQPFCLAGNNSGKETIYDICGYIPSDPIGFMFNQINDRLSTANTKVDLLVIGDSPLDVQAAKSAENIPSVKVKIFKCEENPDIFKLISQLHHISDNFGSIIGN